MLSSWDLNANLMMKEVPWSLKPAFYLSEPDKLETANTDSFIMDDEQNPFTFCKLKLFPIIRPAQESIPGLASEKKWDNCRMANAKRRAKKRSQPLPSPRLVQRQD